MDRALFPPVVVAVCEILLVADDRLASSCFIWSAVILQAVVVDGCLEDGILK